MTKLDLGQQSEYHQSYILELNLRLVNVLPEKLLSWESFRNLAKPYANRGDAVVGDRRSSTGHGGDHSDRGRLRPVARPATYTAVGEFKHSRSGTGATTRTADCLARSGETG